LDQGKEIKDKDTKGNFITPPDLGAKGDPNATQEEKKGKRRPTLGQGEKKKRSHQKKHSTGARRGGMTKGVLLVLWKGGLSQDCQGECPLSRLL